MIICGTGHRPNKLGGYSDPIFDALVRLCSYYLTTTTEKPTLVISGMAQGFDQALAQACLDCGYPYDAYVPHEGQESIWRDPRAKDKYYKLLNSAREVKLIVPGPFAAWKMMKRNEAMVNASDTVLALWDGTGGGTGNCVSYARRMNKNIIHLWDRWQKGEF